jgi:hypothetical protein
MTDLDAAALVTQHVSAAFLAEAVRAVDHAEHTFGANHDRREWAVTFLRDQLHTPEWLSRLLIELAVAFVKTQRDAGAKS